MEELLEKIKKTESDADIIVKNAEIQVQKILEEAKKESNETLNEKKKQIILEVENTVNGKLQNAKIEKEKKVKTMIEDFKKKLGNIDKKNNLSEKYLIAEIKKRLKL